MRPLAFWPLLCALAPLAPAACRRSISAEIGRDRPCRHRGAAGRPDRPHRRRPLRPWRRAFPAARSRGALQLRWRMRSDRRCCGCCPSCACRSPENPEPAAFRARQASPTSSARSPRRWMPRRAPLDAIGDGSDFGLEIAPCRSVVRHQRQRPARRRRRRSWRSPARCCSAGGGPAATRPPLPRSSASTPPTPPGCRPTPIMLRGFGEMILAYDPTTAISRT